jgi:predicted DNA-binding protein YlxM (UPF0122 family)
MKKLEECKTWQEVIAIEDDYQHIYHEINVANHQYIKHSNDNSIGAITSSNEEIDRLRFELMEEIRNIISTQLTPKQQEVINLVLDGYDHHEIAVKLGVNQSAIEHRIHGTKSYYGGNKHKRQCGGIYRRIRHIAERSLAIMTILTKIKAIKNDVVFDPTDVILYDIRNSKIGVRFVLNKWEARHCGKYIGRFETYEEAIRARNKHIDEL